MGNWLANKNQRAKLQQIYATLACVLIVIAGLITLINAEVGHVVVKIGLFAAAIFVTNAIVWSLTDAFIAPRIAKLVKSNSKK